MKREINNVSTSMASIAIYQFCMYNKLETEASHHFARDRAYIARWRSIHGLCLDLVHDDAIIWLLLLSSTAEGNENNGRQ